MQTAISNSNKSLWKIIPVKSPDRGDKRLRMKEYRKQLKEDGIEVVDSSIILIRAERDTAERIITEYPWISVIIERSESIPIPVNRRCF